MLLYYPTKNDYLRIVYFESLLAYRSDIKRIDSLDGIKNETILIDAEHLTPSIISKLKNEGNRICAADINDNSVFCYSYSDSLSILDVDMVFKVAGIQKTNHSMNTVISNDCSYSLQPKQFMSEDNWNVYETLKSLNRIHSLPYVLWENYEVPNIPYKDRKKLVLVRGGHHYLRVHLLFNLIKKGLVDQNSLFNTRGYLHQYCDPCKKILTEGSMTIDKIREKPSACSFPVDLDFPPEYFQDRGDWNNGCPTRYFEMAEIMDVDRGMVENALNGSYAHMSDYYDILNKYTLYADLKWIFSIYAPPRFWEAATAHTVNLVPRRTNDQDYFPKMIEGEHYITFSEDFSDLSTIWDFNVNDYLAISENCYSLYDHWIKAGQFKLSVNLMNHIMAKIEV